ncbi:MAG TPA: hypothetical protein VFQ21_04290 [Gemmatimonadota bacterium]|nr:hypothetical protein [Gemmatimonadota bacterium]
MSDSALPLVVTCGERVICHLVEPTVLAGELPRLVELYFAPHGIGCGAPRARSASAELELDPARPIGEQVAPDSEILFPTV